MSGYTEDLILFSAVAFPSDSATSKKLASSIAKSELPNLLTAAPWIACLNVDSTFNSGVSTSQSSPNGLYIQVSTAQVDNSTLNDEEKKRWEAFREPLSAFQFSIDEKDKILGKEFGFMHSTYWGEERKQEVPKYETVCKTLDFLRSLGLSDEDLYKVVKKT